MMKSASIYVVRSKRQRINRKLKNRVASKGTFSPLHNLLFSLAKLDDFKENNSISVCFRSNPFYILSLCMSLLCYFVNGSEQTMFNQVGQRILLARFVGLYGLATTFILDSAICLEIKLFGRHQDCNETKIDCS